jgi:hypothetical protein
LMLPVTALLTAAAAVPVWDVVNGDWMLPSALAGFVLVAGHLATGVLVLAFLVRHLGAGGGAGPPPSGSGPPPAGARDTAGPLGLLDGEEVDLAREELAAVRAMGAGVRHLGGPALGPGEEWFAPDPDVFAERLRLRGASPLQIERIFAVWAFSWLDPATGTAVFAVLQARWAVLVEIGLLGEVLDHERGHVAGGFADGLGHDDEVRALIARIHVGIADRYGARLRSGRVPQGGLPLSGLPGRLEFVRDLQPAKQTAGGRPVVMLVRDAAGHRWVLRRWGVGAGVAVGSVTAATVYRVQLTAVDRVAGASPVPAWLAIATEPVDTVHGRRLVEAGEVVSFSAFGEGEHPNFRGAAGLDVMEQLARHFSITSVLEDWDGLRESNVAVTAAGTLLRFDFDLARLGWVNRLNPLFDPVFARLTGDDVLAQFADRLIDQDRLLSALPHEDPRGVVVERLEWMAEVLRSGRLLEDLGESLERAQHDFGGWVAVSVPAPGYGTPAPRADADSLDLVPRGVRETVSAAGLLGLVTAGRRVWVHAELPADRGAARWDITWDGAAPPRASAGAAWVGEIARTPVPTTVRAGDERARLAAAIEADLAVSPARAVSMADAAARHGVHPREVLAAVDHSPRLLLLVGVGARGGP